MSKITIPISKIYIEVEDYGLGATPNVVLEGENGDKHYLKTEDLSGDSVPLLIEVESKEQ